MYQHWALAAISCCCESSVRQSTQTRGIEISSLQSKYLLIVINTRRGETPYDLDSFILHCFSFPTLEAAADVDILNDEKIAF